MVDVSVTEATTTVTVNGDAAAISVGAGVTQIAAFTPTRYLGSAFSGSDGATSRVKTHTRTISSNLIFVGKTLLDSSTDYSLSTVTYTNDTVTMNIPIYNDDVIIICA